MGPPNYFLTQIVGHLWVNNSFDNDLCYDAFKSKKEKRMRYDGDDWFERLDNDLNELDAYSVETGRKVIAKHVRPQYTVWKQTTVHKRIKASARRSRRVFKQYLKTGSLRLLKAAERKITSWDFD
jgi:hypothetical protein